MKNFKINRNIEIICRSEKTRYGFRHLATLLLKGNERMTAKCCYYNRTWESYEFQSVLQKLVEDSGSLSENQKRICNKFIKNGKRVEDDLKPLKNIGLVMAIGDILGKNQKQKNDWKTRMLKAGLENKGLIMPEDWNELDEAEKEKRLNGITKILTA